MGVTIITIKWSSSTAQDLITYLPAATEEPVAVSKSAAAVAELAPPVVPVVVASVVSLKVSSEKITPWISSISMTISRPKDMYLDLRNNNST